MKRDYLDWALQNSEDLQIALLNYSGSCSVCYPGHELLQAKLGFREKSMLHEERLSDTILFTDESGKADKSVLVWQNQTTKSRESDVQALQDSPQIVEIAAGIVRAFQLFSESFHLITVSSHVAWKDQFERI